MKDKYSALWVSHSSISDFLLCPKAYYLKNIYKNPNTGHKISIIKPPLALGQTVHQVIESLSLLPVSKRFTTSLIERFDQAWKNVSGMYGGFTNKETEELYKKRGRVMMQRLMKNKGPIGSLAIKIQMDLPHYWLSEKDNIILCGKIDWIEYLKETDSVRIIDFKTSKQEADPRSLQLPIYYLLTQNCQNREVSKISYWYLERDNMPIYKPLPNSEKASDKILKIAKQIKLARQLERFSCPSQGCRECNPYETIISGKAILVGINEYKQDVFILKNHNCEKKDSSIIL